MKSRRAWPIIRRIWITAGIGFTLIFVTWSMLAYRASGEARDATRSTPRVDVERGDGVWRFTPKAPRPDAPALIFIPGALVAPAAYAPLAQAVAEAGFMALLVELPLRGAFGGAESAELDARIDRASFTAENRRIVVAGHSRGAVVATRLAAERSHRLAGLIIIGSSHPRDHDLSSLTIPVSKIVGTRDGLAPPSSVRQNARLLPAHTRWVWIDGGNHSQFGWYGFQPMDRLPRTAAATQRRLMIEEVLGHLERVP